MSKVYPVVSYPWTFRTQAKTFRTHFRSIRTQPFGRIDFDGPNAQFIPL